MKKTVTANIGGIVFHIDEDAYEKLNAYLAHVRAHLSSEDGTDEILSDIEGRIAEMFQEKLTATKKVITLSDVKEVIEQLGEPEQFEEGEEEKSTKSRKTWYSEKEHKRLYRDPDDKYLAGVAGGLGAFFNLDPVWIRAAFIIFTFVYGFGPLLYIILWIVVPKASTTAERLEMRGEKVNISNIEKSIREELNDLKDNIKEFSRETQDSFKKKGKKKRNFDSDPNRRSGLIRAIGIAAGVILLIFAFAMLLAIVSSIFLIPFTIYASSGILEFSVPEVLNAFLPSETFSKVAMTGLFLVIAIPVFWIFMMAIQLLFDLRPKLKALGIFTLILWLAGLLMLVFAGLSGARNFTSHYSYAQEYTLDPTQWPNLYLDLDENNRRAYNSGYHNQSLSDWKVLWLEGDVEAAGVPSISIRNSQDDQITLSVIHESRGQSRLAAMENANNIEYSFRQQDSLLIFDPLFFYDKQDGWRNQKIHIELNVPRDKVVVIPSALRKNMPIQWSHNVNTLKER